MTDKEVILQTLDHLKKFDGFVYLPPIFEQLSIIDEIKQEYFRDILSINGLTKKSNFSDWHQQITESGRRLDNISFDNLFGKIDFRKEILLYLLNSNQTITDLRPLIKSLKMTRRDIVDLFSVLENENVLQSDNQWRKFKTISSGVKKSIDEVPFNFRLTPTGEKLTIDRYMNKPIIKIDNLHQGDNYGNYSQSSSDNNSKIKNTQTQSTMTASKQAVFWKWVVAMIGAIAAIATIYEVWLKDFFALAD